MICPRCGSVLVNDGTLTLACPECGPGAPPRAGSSPAAVSGDPTWAALKQVQERLAKVESAVADLKRAVADSKRGAQPPSSRPPRFLGDPAEEPGQGEPGESREPDVIR